MNMIPYLLRALDTNDFRFFVQHLSMSPMDIDLLLYEAIKDNLVELDKEKNHIEVICDVDMSDAPYNVELAEKIQKYIVQYDDQEANITRTRLEGNALDLNGQHGYPIHEFILTLHALENGTTVFNAPRSYTIDVKKKGDMPENSFTFYTYKDHNKCGEKAVEDYKKLFKKK